ncbi:unnamed protein product [Boreogadus saida]
MGDDFTVPLDDALSLLVSSESDDSDRDEEGDDSPGSPSPNGEARGSSIARLCRHLTSSGWSFGGRATGHYRQSSRKPWPCGAHASGPPTPGPAPWHLGARGATRPARLDPIWPMFPAISPYFSGAAAEPGRLGAPVKTFIQVTKTEGLTDRGYRAVPPLDPALCAVFGVKPGLSDRCPTPKDQLTAKLTERAHQCMMQQEAVKNNIALLAHNISTMVAEPRLAEQAVDVAKTAGVILCLCSTGAVAAARTAAWQHLIQRNLWLQQTPGIPEPMRRQLLVCPISPDVLFGPRLSSMVDDKQAASEEAEKFQRNVSRPPPPPGQQRSIPSSSRRHRPPSATVAAPPAAPPPGPQAYLPRPPPSQAASEELESAVMRARLSRQRMETLWSLLRRCSPGNVVTALSVMRLLGMMSAAHTVVPLGLLHMRRLQKWFSPLRIDPCVDQWGHPMKGRRLSERGRSYRASRCTKSELSRHRARVR